MKVTLTREEERMLLNITKIANDSNVVAYRNLYVANRLLEKYGDNEPLCERLLMAWNRGYVIQKTKKEMYKEKIDSYQDSVNDYGEGFKSGMEFVVELFGLEVD